MQTEIERIDQLYRDRLRTMVAVGEMIGGLTRALEDVGELDSTYLIFTSDNGYHMGQHRLALGKDTAYEEDISVPLMIRGPGVPVGVKKDEMVLNNDLAPTFAYLAGVEPSATLDGRSWTGQGRTIRLRGARRSRSAIGTTDRGTNPPTEQ